MYLCIIQNCPSEFRPFLTHERGNRYEICRESGLQPISKPLVGPGSWFAKPTSFKFNSLISHMAVRIVVALTPDSHLSWYSSRHRQIILNHYDAIWSLWEFWNNTQGSHLLTELTITDVKMKIYDSKMSTLIELNCRKLETCNTKNCTKDPKDLCSQRLFFGKPASYDLTLSIEK